MAALGASARHMHLVRAAHSAREAFACAPEEGRNAPRRSPSSIAVWIALGTIAGLVAYVVR